MKPFITLFCSGLLLGLFSFNFAQVTASVFWDESLQGDLSNNQAAPTSITLQSGVNTLVGTAGGLASDNQDWLHLTIPAGLELSAVTLTSFVSSDTTAFSGVQAGSTFSGSPFTASSY